MMRKASLNMEKDPKCMQSQKRPREGGPVDVVNNAQKVKKSKQAKSEEGNFVHEECKKEFRDTVCEGISQWVYDAAIPFSAVNYGSFKTMVESIGKCGVNMKPLSYHEVQGPFLRKEVNSMRTMMHSCEEEWAKYGCSLRVDGWKDEEERTIINFLVNSSKGTFFLQSVDASSYSKSGEGMFELINSFIERIGEAKVIQVVTDNSTTNVLAGKLLEEKRPHLYWTPCAAQSINVMLEDIGKLPSSVRTLKRAMRLNAYIYLRPVLRNLLKRFTGHTKLVRGGVTRFATIYLTLWRIHKLRNNLRRMFLSDDWRTSKWKKEGVGKKLANTVWAPWFWNNVVYMLRIFSPLVRVLRLVSSEKRPAMGYIYEAMSDAKEAIKKALDGKQEKYKEIFKIIDDRWKSHLNKPLHAAGYYLNPEFFYSKDKKTSQSEEILTGFYQTLQKLVPIDEQNKILEQLPLYQNAEKLFGQQIVIRQRNIMSPVEWWSLFGASAPNLQKFAIKVLRLTCASGFHSDCSIFEHVHNKKRNSLAQQRLNDSVFLKYNRMLRRRYDARDRIDPISYGYIDDSNEWLTGSMDGECDDEDKIFPDDDHLTWDAVAKESEVENIESDIEEFEEEEDENDSLELQFCEDHEDDEEEDEEGDDYGLADSLPEDEDEHVDEDKDDSPETNDDDEDEEEEEEEDDDDY